MVVTFLSAYFSLSPQSKRNMNRFRNNTFNYIHDLCGKHSRPSQPSSLFTLPYCPSICSHSIFSFFCPPTHQYYSQPSSNVPHYPFKSPIFFSHFSFSSHRPKENQFSFLSYTGLPHTSSAPHFSLKSQHFFRAASV